MQAFIKEALLVLVVAAVWQAMLALKGLSDEVCFDECRHEGI